MSAPTVLIAEELSDEAAQILRRGGIGTAVKVGRSEQEILKDITDYDAIIVRSATKVTRPIIEAGSRLRVIGRAGVGVDNIDCDAASERGIVVMNTPLGNVVSAAEHTLAMLLALARDIPDAHAEMRQGIWNRNAHVGVELQGKVVGIIGLGKVGQHVANLCRALGMRVLANDPHINPQRAKDIGVLLAGLDSILGESDFLTLHTPMTSETVGIINATALQKMKGTARIVNAARGGIIDHHALAEALQEGIIAGAAIDVFPVEPVEPNSPLLKAPNVILTPHLGASTAEAQSKVAEAIARQLVAFFADGVIQNAVNLAVHLEPELAAYGELAATLGSLAIQLHGHKPAERVKIQCQGRIARSNVRALAVSALAGVLRETTETTVNMVNASQIAEARGIDVVEECSERIRSYASLLSVEVHAGGAVRRISGTCFDDVIPRIVEIDGLSIDLRPAETILIMKYEDRPGMVGKIGTVLGNANINIARMDVGRLVKAGDAVVALTLDDSVPDSVRQAIRDAVHPKELYLVSL